jgi:hypothetical protein
MAHVAFVVAISAEVLHIGAVWVFQLWAEDGDKIMALKFQVTSIASDSNDFFNHI